MLVDDDVANIDTDAENNALVLRYVGIAGDHAALDHDRAGDRIDHTCVFDENSISGRLYDTAMMASDSWVGQFSTDCLQRTQSADLVHAHKTAVANHIGRENGSEPSLSERLFWHVDRASANL